MAVTTYNGRVVVLRGQRNPTGPKTRVCPTCEAPVGHSCQRYIKPDPRWGGGDYWRAMTTFHEARKTA